MNGPQNLLRLSALIAALSGCQKGEAPARFRTISSHFEGAEIVGIVHHEGIRRFGDDLDLDGDNMNDLYMVTNDGTIYATNSRRLIQGEDNLQERTWERRNSEILRYAKPGGYKSP